MLYYNDTSVNSNHVVVDVNKSIVCNEIETSVGNVNFKYDFNMLNILTGTCGQDPPPFFLNIDFCSCKQHFATLYVSLEDIYTIGVAWVFFLVRQLMLGGPGIFLRKWALETHFPEFKWIVYDFNNN